MFKNKYILVGIVIALISGTGLWCWEYFGGGKIIEVVAETTPLFEHQENNVSFAVGGDMMFARMIYHQFNADFNSAVVGLDGVFAGHDAAIVNLEGAITSKPVVDDTSRTFVFKFLPVIVDTLSYLHINGASMANNHSNNAGNEGLLTTRAVLTNHGIQPFGGPLEDGVPLVAKFPGHGLTLAVVGINLTFPNQTPDAALPVIRELKKDPTVRVLVMPHWGTEYLAGHTPEQSQAAHAWIDAGADLVIGSHPHVIEDAEMYKGVPIVYSLGNLLFDQDFSQATQEGLIIEGKFTSKGLTLTGIPTLSTDNKPAVMASPRKEEILEKLCLTVQLSGCRDLNPD
jgi:poly-gamma-glutamate capsule biosynthesis protein CapA/YwtB (metallophosphatase superfamily)